MFHFLSKNFSFCDFIILKYLLLIFSEIVSTSDSAIRRLSPNDKRKPAEASDPTDKRFSEHVNVDLNGEHYDDADDTVQLVRREENEHAIS